MSANTFVEVWDDNGSIFVFECGSKEKEKLSKTAKQLRVLMGRDFDHCLKRNEDIMSKQ